MKHHFPHKLIWLASALLLGMLALPSETTAAGGDASAGARKAVFCAYCHGADGNPPDAKTPRLAGQSAKILVAKMKRKKPYQAMNHPMMQAFVTGGCLNDQDIRNLAAFYAGQPIRPSRQPDGGKPDSR